MLCSSLFTLLCALFLAAAPPSVNAAADIVAILPDRSTAYPNGLHNGLWLGASRFNLTLEIRGVGNFDAAKQARILDDAMNAQEQPRLYAIWPVDFDARKLLQQLYQTTQVPIIQLNQLPSSTSQWEWDHLLGYAGPDDALRSRNAGEMLLEATQNIDKANVVALSYPATYGGYQLCIEAFTESIEGSKLTLARDLNLDWGSQPAYEAVLELVQEYRVGDKDTRNRLPTLHAIYAMDDSILNGAYQALVDLGLEPGKDIVLVGTVCNGARELLESGLQYGTTVQGPHFEGNLAVQMAHEYFTTGSLSEKIRFTPNPIATGDTWRTQLVEFLGETSTVDEACTWDLFYDRAAGPTSVDTADDICQIVSCKYIPTGLFYVGYVLMATNYGLALLVGILLYVYRHKKIISIAQPYFLALVIIGSVVDTTSILFMSRDNRDYSQRQLDAACVVWPILLSVGHMMTTATLVAKIYRIKVLVDAGSNIRRAQVTVRQLSLFIVLFVSLDAVMLLAWYVTDPFRWVMRDASEDLSGYVSEVNGVCSSDGENAYLFPLFIGILHLVVLIYANFLAYQTSAYHRISDSKSVAIALFNSIQLLMIGAPVLALVGDNVGTSYLIRICFVFLNNFGVLALIVLPKMYQCVIGRGDILPEVDLSKSAAAVSENMEARSKAVVVPSSAVCAVDPSRTLGGAENRGSPSAAPSPTQLEGLLGEETSGTDRQKTIRPDSLKDDSEEGDAARALGDEAVSTEDYDL